MAAQRPPQALTTPANEHKLISNAEVRAILKEGKFVGEPHSLAEVYNRLLEYLLEIQVSLSVGARHMKFSPARKSQGFRRPAGRAHIGARQRKMSRQKKSQQTLACTAGSSR